MKLLVGLVDVAQRGDLDPAVWLELRDALAAVKGPGVGGAAKRFGRFLGSQPLGKYAVARAGGNVGRGADLFFGRTDLSCVRCHVADGRGGAVGPNLSGIGALKPSEYLVESIVDPNKTIAEGFQTVLVLTDEGRTVTGVLRAEDDATPDARLCRRADDRDR